MDSIKVVAISDTVVLCTLFVCVTRVAMHFGDWRIMFLCLIGLLFGHSFRQYKNDVAEK